MGITIYFVVWQYEFYRMMADDGLGWLGMADA